MKVEVKLFANLRNVHPELDRGVGEIELGSGASLANLLEHLSIGDRQAQMVLVNGSQIARDPAARANLQLEDGDSISIFPPVAGG